MKSLLMKSSPVYVLNALCLLTAAASAHVRGLHDCRCSAVCLSTACPCATRAAVQRHRSEGIARLPHAVYTANLSCLFAARHITPQTDCNGKKKGEEGFIVSGAPRGLGLSRMSYLLLLTASSLALLWH